MSRLYVKTVVDKKVGSKARRAHREINATVYWGSRDWPKTAVSLFVEWDKDWVHPKVWVNGNKTKIFET